jgi:hypothetical protein
MPTKKVKTVYIVGAGFSSYAGLPLTTNFTDAMLKARGFSAGPSKLIVDFVSQFIRDSFDISVKATGDKWPDLEDIFTCVDLSANSGHHLGGRFAPADLRTVRRSVLSRIIRMLDQSYKAGRKAKSPDWLLLDNFFSGIDLTQAGFVSMNWDNVIERKIQLNLDGPFIDYGCDAIAAGVPDLPNPDDFNTDKQYLKALLKARVVSQGKPLSDAESAKCVPVIKIHGSINWLYCDNCRRLFWVHPDQASMIADQLITTDDLRRMEKILGKKGVASKQDTIDKLKRNPPMLCVCTDDVRLGARIATFSYRKALEFPMFQKSWFAAEGLLREAEEWVFLGYSLPAADFEFKYLLKRTQLSRSKPPIITVVSGGKPAAIKATRSNYAKFFGRGIKKSTFFGGGLSAYIKS